MLLINGVITLIGLVFALIVYFFYVYLGVTGLPLIVVGAVALWGHLFVSDIAEDKLIEMFDNP